jgi:hypothetical protein
MMKPAASRSSMATPRAVTALCFKSASSPVKGSSKQQMGTSLQTASAMLSR